MEPSRNFFAEIKSPGTADDKTRRIRKGDNLAKVSPSFELLITRYRLHAVVQISPPPVSGRDLFNGGIVLLSIKK
jgi:hypothetical protein